MLPAATTPNPLQGARTPGVIFMPGVSDISFGYIGIKEKFLRHISFLGKLNALRHI